MAPSQMISVSAVRIFGGWQGERKENILWLCDERATPPAAKKTTAQRAKRKTARRRRCSGRDQSRVCLEPAPSSRLGGGQFCASRIRQIICDGPTSKRSRVCAPQLDSTPPAAHPIRAFHSARSTISMAATTRGMPRRSQARRRFLNCSDANASIARAVAEAGRGGAVMSLVAVH